jgi:hypothetical protein
MELLYDLQAQLVGRGEGSVTEPGANKFGLASTEVPCPMAEGFLRTALAAGTIATVNDVLLVKNVGDVNGIMIGKDPVSGRFDYPHSWRIPESGVLSRVLRQCMDDGHKRIWLAGPSTWMIGRTIEYGNVLTRTPDVRAALVARAGSIVAASPEPTVITISRN